jgi:hypothetical protein
MPLTLLYTLGAVASAISAPGISLVNLLDLQVVVVIDAENIG